MDHYRILGVERDASEVEIKKAYRELAKGCHPDFNKARNAEYYFIQINNAYETLMDPIKRQNYDDNTDTEANNDTDNETSKHNRSETEPTGYSHDYSYQKNNTGYNNSAYNDKHYGSSDNNAVPKKKTNWLFRIAIIAGIVFAIALPVATRRPVDIIYGFAAGSGNVLLFYLYYVFIKNDEV